MIFVTLGSQKFPFNRLLQKLDEMKAAGLIADEIFAQTGASTYVPRHFQTRDFMDRDTFAQHMAAAELVITHAGTGAIIGAVKQGKKVIALPRLAKYGEHVDDHQTQIVAQFSEMGIIEPCYDTEDLPAAYTAAREKTYTPYISNTHTILADLAAFLQEL